MNVGEANPQGRSADFTWRTFVFVLWYVCGSIAMTGVGLLLFSAAMGFLIRSSSL